MKVKIWFISKGGCQRLPLADGALAGGQASLNFDKTPTLEASVIY